MAMGTTEPLTLPRDYQWAMESIGNCISEYHGIYGLMMGFYSWMNVSKDFPRISVADMLMVHRDQCLTADSIQITTDERWIYLSKTSPVDIHDDETIMLPIQGVKRKACAMIEYVGNQQVGTCEIHLGE